MNVYAKAIMAGLVAGLSTAQVALGDNVITAPEWIKVVLATLAAVGFVWGVPNATKPPDISK